MPPRLEHVLGVERGATRACVAVFEVRFATYLSRRFCHLTLAVFTHPPHDSAFRPAGLGASPDGPLTPEIAREVMGRFVTDVRRSFGDWVDRFFHAGQFHVFGRVVQPPVFIVAVPQLGSLSWRTVADAYASALLEADADAAGVALGEFTGRIGVLRRLVPAGDEDHPRYLLVPELLDEESLHGRQELAASELIRTFTDAEAKAAANVYAVDAEFDVLSTHLLGYEAVAEEAADLWDALAFHLLLWHGRPLRQVHESVELLHQTLLQGLADLGHIARDVRRIVDHVDKIADELRDTFDRCAAERSDASASVRGSLSEPAYFARIRRQGEKHRRTAERIVSDYTTLLDAIGRAFDERRARESDVVAKSALPVALAIGALGLVTVVQTTFAIAWTGLSPAAVEILRVLC